jgi:hypothetical protein
VRRIAKISVVFGLFCVLALIVLFMACKNYMVYENHEVQESRPRGVATWAVWWFAGGIFADFDHEVSGGFSESHIVLQTRTNYDSKTRSQAPQAKKEGRPESKPQYSFARTSLF